MAPGRVAAFLPLALGRSLAPSNSPVSCRLECFRGRHAGPVEKGQQLGGQQPGDARVWVDPHVEVAQAAPADGSLFSSGGGVGRAAVAVDEACAAGVDEARHDGWGALLIVSAHGDIDGVPDGVEVR